MIAELEAQGMSRASVVSKTQRIGVAKSDPAARRRFCLVIGQIRTRFQQSHRSGPNRPIHVFYCVHKFEPASKGWTYPLRPISESCCSMPLPLTLISDLAALAKISGSLLD